MNDLIAARALIDEYHQFDPDNRVVRRMEASCDAKQGKIELSMKKFMELIEEYSNDTSSKVLLAKLRMRVPRLQTPEEIAFTKEILLTVIEISPDHQQAQILLERLPKE